MTVVERGIGDATAHFVVERVNAVATAGPFSTSSEAWRWIDRNDGEPVYIFDHVDGHGRNNLATFKDEKDVAIEAACLMAQGYDVVWDDPSKLLTLNDFDPRGAA